MFAFVASLMLLYQMDLLNISCCRGNWASCATSKGLFKPLFFFFTRMSLFWVYFFLFVLFGFMASCFWLSLVFPIGPRVFDSHSRWWVSVTYCWAWTLSEERSHHSRHHPVMVFGSGKKKWETYAVSMASFRNHTRMRSAVFKFMLICPLYLGCKHLKRC